MPFSQKSEETIDARGRYTNSLTVTSSIQCKQIITKVVLSEKLVLNVRETRKPVESNLALGYVYAYGKPF